QKRVFAEVLKISAVERRAINIHSRTEQKMFPFGARISADLRSNFFGQRRVPRRCQRNSASHHRRWAIVAYTQRSVSSVQRRQTQLWISAYIEDVDAA